MVLGGTVCRVTRQGGGWPVSCPVRMADVVFARAGFIPHMFIYEDCGIGSFFNGED